jgi:hypothetical protein
MVGRGREGWVGMAAGWEAVGWEGWVGWAGWAVMAVRGRVGRAVA